jgi:predicted transcriptional regulator
MKADELTKLLFDLGMYDVDAAEKLNVRPETVYKWMNGKKRIPDHYANIINGWREPNAKKQSGAEGKEV